MTPAAPPLRPPDPTRHLARQLADDKRHLGAVLFSLAVRVARDPHTQALSGDLHTVVQGLQRGAAVTWVNDPPPELAAAVPALTLTVLRLQAGRAARDDARLPAGEVAPRLPLHPPRPLPTGPLTERLQRRLAAEVTPWLRRCYAIDVCGDLEVRLSRDPQASGVTSTVGIAPRVPTATRTRHAVRVTHYVLTLPSAWWRRVKQPGLTLIDGRLTLDAEPLAPTPDAELYALTYVCAGPQQRLHTGYGVLAREPQTGETALGGDATRALRQLRVRRALRGAPR